MIKGIGIDIVELNRIKKTLEQNERFAKRILTEKEMELFQSLGTEKRKVEFLSGRFAAKEAYSKAKGTGLGKLSFKDIEILPNEFGAPLLVVKESQGEKNFVSISHSESYAVAQVVIEQ